MIPFGEQMFFIELIQTYPLSLLWCVICMSFKKEIHCKPKIISTAFYILFTTFKMFKILLCGTSLVIQWLRFCSPVQEMWVRSLAVELDPTCLWPKIKTKKQKQYGNKLRLYNDPYPKKYYFTQIVKGPPYLYSPTQS